MGGCLLKLKSVEIYPIVIPAPAVRNADFVSADFTECIEVSAQELVDCFLGVGVGGCPLKLKSVEIYPIVFPAPAV